VPGRTLGIGTGQVFEFNDRQGHIIPGITLSTPAVIYQPDNALRVWASPNPFSHHTTLEFTIAEPGDIRLDVSDALGKTVYSTTLKSLPTGTHHLVIPGEDMIPGSYFYTLAYSAASSGPVIYRGKLLLMQ